MNLTPEQSNTIRHWGEKTQHVNEIRLFGAAQEVTAWRKATLTLP